MAKSFDYQVDHYGKDGRVIRNDPYRMVIDQDGKRLERPPGSGIWYAEDGTIIKDDSKVVEAVRLQKLAADQKVKDDEAAAARESLKQDIRKEIEAEAEAKFKEKTTAEATKVEIAQKGQSSGSRPKN